MDWQLIEYNSYTGRYNMDFDLQLVKTINTDQPILRFYGWEPHCISLGANQSYDDINLELTASNNIDVVKRPTGGRAILHAQELTYSVIMPNSQYVSGRKLYEDISNAIVIGLKSYHPNLNEVELEQDEPDFSRLLKEPSGALCFASSAKSEIKHRGKKLVGSAQRKLGSTILQHGSILIGREHTNLVHYLNTDLEEKNKLLTDISDKTTEIFSIIKQEVNLLELQNNIINGFEKLLGANFCVTEFEKIA
jgi:lipoate-protein ligase A